MEQFTVRRLSVGFGPAARPRLQRALGAMAARADTSTDAGRLAALRDVAALLGGELARATHSLLVDAVRSLEDAPPFFDAMTEELRGRYPHETQRNDVSTPVAVEGDPSVPGHLVVSAVLGAVGVLPTVEGRGRAGLAAAVEALRSLDAVVMALEVIWSPSVEADRMSLSAMTDRYPELSPLDA
jgi:uncharacterized membrane protein